MTPAETAAVAASPPTTAPPAAPSAGSDGRAGRPAGIDLGQFSLVPTGPRQAEASASVGLTGRAAGLKLAQAAGGGDGDGGNSGSGSNGGAEDDTEVSGSGHADETVGDESEFPADPATTASAAPVRAAAAALERLLHDGRDSDDNDFLIGVAMSAGPSYSGASDTTYSIRPAARLTWRGYSISTQSVARASARVESTSGGERTGFSGPLQVRNRFSYGFGATINRGRDISPEGASIGLKSLPSTIFGRVRFRYALDERTSISATLIGDVLNRQRNLELPISIGRHYILSDRMLLGLNAGMNFVNRRSMDNDYGIGPAQSQASGKPIYQPKAGLREVAVSATLIHEPNDSWIWMTQFSLVRLVGEAARSPLVKQTVQPNLMFGLAYRLSWD